MGRCQHAPTVCVGKNYVDNASASKVEDVIKDKNFDVVIPSYISLDEYKKNGGYKIVNQIRIGEITDRQIIDLLKSIKLIGSR